MNLLEKILVRIALVNTITRAFPLQEQEHQITVLHIY
jgi:hypothetical protein